MKKLRTIDIPQANTLTTVGDLVALVDSDIRDQVELSGELRIDPRQVEYYAHAARILGFLKRGPGKYYTTTRGKAYLQAKTQAEKRVLLKDAVFQTKIFQAVRRKYTDSELNRANIVAFLRESTDLTGGTPERRADTLTAWLKTVSEFDPEDHVSIAEHSARLTDSLFQDYEKREANPLHDQLKHLLANEPQRFLKERLTLIAEEYPFATHDRADLLFVDERGNHLAVEVEVEVGAGDVVGLLQAAKYKALVTVQFGRRPSAVRGMLVAKRIHRAMRDRAARNGLEARELGETRP